MAARIIIVQDEAAMIAFGAELALQLRPGDWVAIDGPLGAGKTVLCKGILRGLGYDGEVASPSYAIVHPYDPPAIRIPVSHVDLYRLNNSEELEQLGLGDASNDCIHLVEWSSRAGGEYGNPTHKIDIHPNDDGSRTVEMKIFRI
jgi:tRNA threonylcarbamoyladenosine biosynthesis protein TsaE